MRLAWDLRSGQLAIALKGDPAAWEPSYVLIPRELVERIQGLEPDRILFFNETPPDKEDPAERLYGTD